jgi:signal transduction histidine kinase
MATLTIMQGILIATIAIGTAGGLLAWRERPEPGAVPLTILLAGQCWWSATLFFRVSASGMVDKIFWMDVTWVGLAILPVAWLFFSLSYTGYSQYIKPRYVALASIIPAITVVLGLTNDFHHLMYVRSTLVEINGDWVLSRTPGIWYWVIGAYTYALGFVGAIPLLQFVTSQVNIFRGQSLAILFGVTVPWGANALYLLGVLPTGGIDPTPIAFSLSAMAFLGALTRFQLFGTSPTPIRPARQSAFERMAEGVIVLDRNDNIVDLNEQAEEVIATDSGETLGNSVDAVLPHSGDLTNGSSNGDTSVFDPEDDSGAYDISVNEITDDTGRTTGQIVILHDISEYLRQQQRLEVLNRVFRHNIRTNTQIIVSQADYLADHNSEDRAQTVQQNALEIKEFSDKIRTILNLFEERENGDQTVSLGTLVWSNVETIRDTFPEVSIHTDVGSEVEQLYVDSRLDDVVFNVLENAAQHNPKPDPQIWVEVTREDDHVQIAVTDNGPGIEETELVLIEEGMETPLNHGSGLGLALIVWGTDILGGDVTFESNDPTGLVVTLDVPIHSRSTDG